MATFSEITAVEVSKERAKTYATLLADVPLADLEPALVATAKKCVWGRFPAPKDILDQVKAKVEAVDDLQAFQQWDLFRFNFRNHWHPDVGNYGNPTELDAAGQYAARLIGGFLGFMGSDPKNESFIRRDFVTAYKRFRETGGLLAPTREEAAALLDRLQKELPTEVKK